MTAGKSLVDRDGYFHPLIWKDAKSLSEHAWSLDEIEKEFRAQIEMVKKYIPRVSHVSGHMGCYDFDPEVKAMIRKICAEYNLYVDGADKDAVLLCLSLMTKTYLLKHV